MNDKVILTVCIVAYNCEAYIEECMEGVIKQQGDINFEILVGEDCSTDRTREVLEKYENRATIIKRDENVGLCANMHDLLMRAKGRYVIVLAGDDYICNPLALKKQVDFLESNAEYNGVAGWHYFYIQKEKRKFIVQNQEMPVEFTLKDYLQGKNIFFCNGVMRNTFRKDRNKITYFLEGARNNEEIKVDIYTLSKGNVYILQEPMYVYRYVNDENGSNYNSTTTMLEQFKDYKSNYMVVKKQFDKRYNLKPIKLKLYNRYMIRMSGSLGELTRFLKEISVIDIFELFLYKIYLLTHNYQDPEKWKNVNYLFYQHEDK